MRRTWFRGLLRQVCADAGSEVLVVTNMWPDEERPTYGIFIKRQVDDLRRAGFACDVLYLRGFASPLAYPLAAARFALSSVASRGRYRLVHVHAGETALAARFHVGTPMLVSYCGDDVIGDKRADGSMSWRARCRAAVVRQHALLFPGIVTKSSAMRDRLPPRVRQRTTVLANGVDLELFAPMPRDEARRVLGWDPDEVVVLFAATKTDSPAKRRWLAEDVCQALSARGIGARLHVAEGVPPDEVPILMNAADCLLVTSAVEGSPNVVKEAVMCNLPVVTTRVGDVEDVLTDVEPSSVCGDDANVLADAVAACVSPPRRSNGRAASQRFDAKSVAARMGSIYSALMRPGSGEETPLSAAPETTRIEERLAR